MKHHSFITKKVLIIAAAIVFLFASCDPLIGKLNPSSTTTTTTATTVHSPDTTILTKIKPVISLSTTVEAKSAKVITSGTFTFRSIISPWAAPRLPGLLIAALR